MTFYFTGLGLGLSLIIAIGAQNAFVLRQGIRREHLLAVAFICAMSDAVLIAIGVSGVGLALQTLPWLVTTIRWVGVAFLTWYAFLAFRRAWKPGDTGLLGPSDGPGSSNGTNALASESAVANIAGTTTSTRLATTPALWGTVLTTLAITWLNPHVYLDTVFMLGSIAQAQGDGRWIFAAGAITGSFLWFFAVAYGARLLSRWLATPRAWRIVDFVIGIIMLVIAFSLATGH